ncbi:hypothetical protein [Amycolatopsis jejuensis]|uniref:hypothetical protein n=1 Tax=Amycolatopsis jejuensis TaxID=330084 RepID=UPI000525563C|nr:hypothetical protein [Amycolatopsis jejuensis]
MTYPPQPGQGGDPYGQGWQQPGSGGVPQQPRWDPNAQQPASGGVPQQPGWDPNAQPQPGWDPNQQQWNPQQYPGQQQYAYPTQQYPQQGWDPNQQYGAGGPQPPKNNKTGLWIGLAVVVVLLAALGITGFVAPGFFLSKDDKGTTQAQPPAPSSSPQLPTDESSPPTDESTAPSTGGGSASGPAKQTVDAFMAKINAKDAAGATSMVCPGTESFSKDSIDEATKGDPKLTVAGYEGTATVTANLDGTLSGKDANGSVIVTKVGGNWCVGFFFVLAF